MGFFDLFFGERGSSALSACSVDETDELREVREYRDTLKSFVAEKDFRFLEIPPIEAFGGGDPGRAKLALFDYRKRLEDYLAMGGAPGAVNFESFDEAFRRLEYLNTHGCPERQYEFLGMSYQETVAELAREEVDLARIRDSLNSSSLAVGGDGLSAKESGEEFERLCCALVKKMGLDAQMTKGSGDGGIDIVAASREPLFSGKYIIQCKRYAGSVGEPIVRDLFGVVSSERANKGILMTTGTITASARAFAADKQLELIDGESLRALFENYGIDAGNKAARGSDMDLVLRDCLGIDFDNYVALDREEPDPLMRLCRKIDTLYNAIGTAVMDKPITCVHALASILDDMVDELVSAGSLESRRGRWINYAAWLIRAEYCMLTCNFAESAASYLKVAEEWKDIREDGFGNTDYDSVAWVSLSAVTALNSMGLSAQAEQVLSRFEPWISEMERVASEPFPDNDLLFDFKEQRRTAFEDVKKFHVFACPSFDMGEKGLAAAVDASRPLDRHPNFGFESLFCDTLSDSATLVWGFVRGLGGKEATICESYNLVAVRESSKYLREPEGAASNRAEFDLDRLSAVYADEMEEEEALAPLKAEMDALGDLISELNSVDDDSALYDPDSDRAYYFGIYEDDELMDELRFEIFEYSLWVIGVDTDVNAKDAYLASFLDGENWDAEWFSQIKPGGQKELVPKLYQKRIPAFSKAFSYALNVVGYADPVEPIVAVYEHCGEILIGNVSSEEASIRSERVSEYCSMLKRILS